MKLRIGLLKHSPGWEQLCLQEGVPFAVIDPTAQGIETECSLMVVNRMLTLPERSAIEQYLRHGGAVIGYSRHLLRLVDIDGTDQEISYVVGESGEIFPSVQLLDVGMDGFVPRGANAMRTDSNTFAIAAGPRGGGFVVVLPFDVEVLLNDARHANKNFYFRLDRLPSERVSLVGKGEALQLVHDAFVYLHHARRIPYVHLWYFPRDLQNVFGFRVDTDGAPQGDIDALYTLGRDHEIAMSWFLDVKGHEQWLSHFRYFVDQEIGLHCYEHQTYATVEDNARNITKGLQVARRSGIESKAFAAPYGIWNQELAKAIDASEFTYSSEFSFAYDTLPLFPTAGSVQFTTLQVPIHPICIGNMLKVGYTSAQMSEYFSGIVGQKIQRHQPLFFYHHPSHRQWETIADLFQLVRKAGIENMTMGAYAHWWKQRLDMKMSVDLNGEEIVCEQDDSNGAKDVWLRIIHAQRGEATVPVDGKINMGSIRWIVTERHDPLPSDIRRIREFDPRQMVGDIYNKLIRKRR